MAKPFGKPTIAGKRKRNQSWPQKRHKFKRFAERLEEVDIDVFRSLTPVKFEPSGGSSFFHETLVQWRELNASADFIEIYEKLLPLVQTLPQLLLHKNFIINQLLSCLRLSAILSLEPILSLIAILSRDLREDFLPFFSKILNACFELIQSGADREPEVLEQVFTSISYVIKYTLNFLTKDIKFVLRITRCLRHYHKSYIQEFAAEAVSYLLRKAPLKELVKGVRKLIAEVEVSPSEAKVSGCSALLFHALRSSSGLHSGAQRLLRLLIDETILDGVKRKGEKVVLDILSGTFDRLCQELDRDELEVVWGCLTEEISCQLVEDKASVSPELERIMPKVNVTEAREKMKMEEILQMSDGNSPRFVRLLSLLNGMLEFRKGIRVKDFKSLFMLAQNILMNTFSSSIVDGSQQISLEPLSLNGVVNNSGRIHEAYRFFTGLIKSHSLVAGSSIEQVAMSTVTSSLAAAFDCGEASCVLAFIEGVIESGGHVVRSFTSHIVRALSRLLESHPTEVLSLFVDVFGMLNVTPYQLRHLLNDKTDLVDKLVPFVIQVLQCSIENLDRRCKMVDEGMSVTEVLNHEPAVVWSALQCLPYMIITEENSHTIAWQFATSIEQFLAVICRGLEDLYEDRTAKEKIWEPLIGLSLKTHLQILLNRPDPFLEKQISVMLGMAISHPGSVHVLTAVADFLEACMKRTILEISPIELQTEATISMLQLFGKNLSESNNALRVASLRFLNVFEPLSVQNSEIDAKGHQEHMDKTSYDQPGIAHCQVLEHLLSIETTPLTIENSRRSCSLISRLKMELSKGRIPEPYLIPLAHAMLGMFYHRFTLLWDAAMDCLAVLIEEHSIVVWEMVLSHMMEGHKRLVHSEEDSKRDIKEENTSKGVWASLDSFSRDHDDTTDHVTVVMILLRTLQKIPRFSESHSRQLIPLFLNFVEQARSRDEMNLKVGRKYPNQLWQEWLKLLKEMKNARSFFRGPALKHVILSRFIIAQNPSLQEAAFDVLLNWKDPFLIPYVEHLKNIISSKSFREELTVWNVGREAQQVKDEHRQELIPVLIKILYPKVAKVPSKSLRKSAGDVRKIVILPFLASLETHELALLFCLLLRPFQSVVVPPSGVDGGSIQFTWEAALSQGVTPEFLNWVDKISASAVPYKRKLGFLNLVSIMLDIFDAHHIEPYLHALLAFVLRFLEASPSTSEVDRNNNNRSSSNVLSFVDGEKVESTRGNISVVNDLSIAETDSEIEVEHLQTASAVEGITNVEGKCVLTPASNTEADAVQMYNGADHKAEITSKINESIKEEVTDMNINDAVAAHTLSGTRTIRTLCLKIICKLLSNFENLNLTLDFWKVFFHANESSICRIREESISSSTTGALFSCILAMSKSAELALYLTWNKALIPNLLSILTFRQASPSSVSATLTFVENIIHTGSIDSGNIPSIVITILIPHLPILLAGLQVRITLYEEHRTGKGMGMRMKRELRIISHLSKYVKDHSQACQLVNALLPFLKPKRLVEQEPLSEMLELVREFAPNLDDELLDKCLHLMASLLASLTFQRVRLAICTLIQEFAQVRPSLGVVAEILTDLNAMSKTRVEEYDYDARLDAYARVTVSFLSQCTCTEASLLLSNFVYDMSSEDMSLRHSASNSLKLFVSYTATLSEETDGSKLPELASGNQQDKSRFDGVLEGDNRSNDTLSGNKASSSTPMSTKLVVQKVLPMIWNGVGAEVLAIRREWVSLLRQMVVHFSEASPFRELRPLISDDLEVDFFSNIVHLQVHRRIKAMAKFRAVCVPGQFSEGSLTRILVPLFMTSLFGPKVDKEGNLVEAAIQTVGCIAAQLQWTSYFSLVMRCFHLIVSRRDYQKVLLHLVCSILERFHFYMDNDRDVEMVSIGENDVPNDKKLSQVNGFGASTARPHIQTVLPEVYIQLQRKVLPEITAFLVSKEGIANVSVALAVVKVLKLMPPEVVERELPRILQMIINLLKSRSQAVRDEARSALVSMAEALGAAYVCYIVNILQKALTRGYELHVLAYTLNSILVKLVPTVNVGDLDYCLDKILEILEGDIFGTVSEEKDVEALSVKMKEIKHMRSFESIMLVAQVTSFRLKCFTLLSPVRKNLPSSLSARVRSSVKSFLKHLSSGFLSNPSVDREELFVFIHGLIEEGINSDAPAARGSLDNPANEDLIHGANEIRVEELQKKSDSSIMPQSTSVANIHLLAEFALDLFNRNIKRVKVNRSDVHTLSMLDPFVELLERCLYSSNDGVLCGAIKCLSCLLRLPLPSTARLGKKLLNLLFSIIQRSGKSETSLTQACLKLWVVLLGHSSKTKISQVQTRMLLDFPVFVDLETSPSPLALSLLKAIVRRKLLVPELYDMISRVERLMVTSQMLPIRQLCSEILLQFLLDYPLGRKRLQQHLNFFINNLGYEHTTGRETVLEMIHTVVLKFPETFIEEHVESFFFPMVTRLVNDDDNNIRAMVGTVLKLLIRRASPQTLQHIIEICFTWLQKENRHLWRLGTQLTGFLIETLKGKFSRHVDHVLEAVTGIIQHLCLSEDYGAVQHTEKQPSGPWEEVYFALTMVEKLYQQFPERLHQPLDEKLQDFILSLLLHQHIWVRKVCLRLIDMSVIKYGTPDVMRVVVEPSLMMHPSKLILLGASICQQLDTGFFDEEMGEMIAKNLAFVTAFLHSLLQAMAKSNSSPGFSEFLNCENQASQIRISKALKLLKADKYKDGSGLQVIGNSTSIQEVDMGQKKKSIDRSLDNEVSTTILSNDSVNFILLLIFRRVEKTALQVHNLQVKTVFKWYITISTLLGRDSVLQFLQFMLRPLYKITEGFSAKIVQEDLKASGEEVLNQLREIVGVEKFLQVYNSIRHSVKQRSEERKRTQRIASMVDPEKHAKRKLHLISKRRAQKRRKVGDIRK